MQFIPLLVESPGWGSSSPHAQSLFWASRDYSPCTLKTTAFQPSLASSLPSARTCFVPLAASQNMKVWSKQYIFIKVPHVKNTLFEQCCLSRDVQLCCCAHLNINNKYGKDTFPCGLWDLPSAIPTTVGVTADLLNFVVFYTTLLLCCLCKSSWTELRAKNQKVWK